MWQNYLYGKLAQMITFAVLLVGCGIFWYWAIGEEKAIFQDSSKRLDDETLTIRKMEVQLGAVEEVHHRYQSNLREMDAFHGSFLKNKQERMVAISRFLEERTRHHQLDKDVIRYQSSPSKDKGMELFSIDVPLIGRYRNIRAFLDDIEHSELFLNITELTLEDSSENTGAVRVQLTLSTYFEGGSPS